MKKYHLLLSAIGTLLLTGCDGEGEQNQVVSTRYMHKYGYSVPKEEWSTNQYPGQVITTLRNGVTITSTYENNVLHGPTTHTHPHSQTVQHFFQYNHGDLVKETEYDAVGMPIREKVKLSPQRYCLTQWYNDGTPMSVEDYAGEELVQGEYFTPHNETESRIDRGIGTRIVRDRTGALLSHDHFDKGYLAVREAFYPNGNLESITNFTMNIMSGERKTFSLSGEPLAHEEFVNGILHGKATYFLNGVKQAEVFFLNGTRNGVETHFIDGKTVEEEILWFNDKRHGPSKFYVDGVAQVDWYYNGKKVSKKRYDELEQIDHMMAEASAKFAEGAAVR